MIFLVLAGKNLDENLAEIRRYRPHINGAELRADFLDSPRDENWPAFFGALAGLPLILTVRKPEDGGLFRESENSREELFLYLLSQGGFHYIDLEETSALPAVEAAARAKGLRVIRSFHDFDGVPENLVARVRGLAREPGDIPKAAVMPKSAADLERVLDALSELRGAQKILLGMGAFGFATRVLAPKLGSYLTFASPAGDSLAPGLIDPETLASVYRYHSQSPATRVFGIIGNPVLHSKSPRIHGAGYTKLGIDAVYVPFHADSFEDFLPVMRKLAIGGLSVTSPFKENVIPFCTEKEAAVDVIGACNTLVPREGGLAGYNTDAEGFISPLRRAFPEGLRGVSALVIGAGGAARAAVYALAREGARVRVVNRTPEKARRLCGEIARAPGLHPAAVIGRAAESAPEPPEVIVNASTMGMHPQENLDPFAGRGFRGGELVYDMVYNPRETLFLRRARAAGCRLIYGEEMLLAQAYRQFYLYTGKKLEADNESSG